MKQRRRPLVVVLGEDDNDRQAIRVLVAALRPDIGRGGLKPLRVPPALVRNVPPNRLPRHADKVREILKAFEVATPIRAVLMHEDADDVEPAHEAVSTKIEQTFRSLPWPVHPVVPAWEIETWWFLFPEAVRQVCPGWRPLSSYAGRDVGQIRNAKQELTRALTPAGARKSTFRAYSEADSVQIAERIVALGQLAPPWFARSKSWLAFLGAVDSL
ncbi:hypothetical protein HNR22_001075 [Micromonospora jinlongensis]|uniref:DUF4276 domain-containing protein n=1 Tax=Micromonospora jinlongensis TaxID=1287877 RepID=A0A7Y9WZF5_9ACTN|nr:hypothetical protein [Micromonospora jinlongensis]NYH41348.1 hypothetical protein [Micromonospora jinlongensis]